MHEIGQNFPAVEFSSIPVHWNTDPQISKEHHVNTYGNAFTDTVVVLYMFVPLKYLLFYTV